jgi:Zn-finger nucleic acid-binding protein
MSRRRSQRTCPIDGSELAARRRSGIEIDECPECRGVWLDSGELDGLIGQEGTGGRAYVSIVSPGPTLTAPRQLP